LSARSLPSLFFLLVLVRDADFLTVDLPFIYFLVQLLINGTGGVEKAGKTALS